jgi:hypothetical protein
MASIPQAIESYYSLTTPSVIPLYAGPLLFRSRRSETPNQADCTVSLRFMPRPRLAFNGAPMDCQTSKTLDRPGNLGGSDPWEDAESCRHSGSTPRSCVSAR